MTNAQEMVAVTTDTRCEPSVEETLEARIERLGRERPPAFRTAWIETTFVLSIVMSQFLTEFLVSGFPVILPVLIRKLDIPQGSSVWPATAFSLVIAGTLLIFGRLGDMLGGRLVFLSGMSWLLAWSIVAGFSTSPLMLDLCRALQGLGASAALPAGVMLLGSAYRPGPRKNLVFAVYGTFGVLGFFGGILVAGIVGEFLHWGWYFWISAIITGATLCLSLAAIPSGPVKSGSSADVKMDYLGSLTIVTGLVLTVFALTQSAHASAGWATPYIPICFALGIGCLFCAVYIELYVASAPLLPASVFATPTMTPLAIALFLLYGTWGIFSVYGTLYFQDIMGVSPLQVVAWYVPIGVVGLLGAVVEGFILHRVPGRILLVISGIGALGSQLLLALMPMQGAYYWAWIFPAMVLTTIGIDLSTILATVFITTQFPLAQQGLAGGVINSILQLGVAVILSLTDILQSATVQDVGVAQSYKYTFWFGVAAGAASLLILLIWGNVPKATSDLTADERAELVREASCVDT